MSHNTILIRLIDVISGINCSEGSLSLMSDTLNVTLCGEQLPGSRILLLTNKLILTLSNIQKTVPYRLHFKYQAIGKSTLLLPGCRKAYTSSTRL